MHSNTSIELNQFRSLFVQCNEKSTIPLTPKLSLIWWRCLYCKCNETMEMALAINQLPNYNFIDAKNSKHHTQSKPFKYSCDSIKKNRLFLQMKMQWKIYLAKESASLIFRIVLGIEQYLRNFTRRILLFATHPASNPPLFFIHQKKLFYSVP